jgi:hypothetical protein
MRFVIAFFAAWLGLVAPADAARSPERSKAQSAFRVAQLLNFPPGVFQNRAALDASPSTTTFDPANLGTGQALSNGNLTVTGNTNAIARTVTNHNSGKYYAEITVNSLTGNNSIIGAVDSSASLNNYLGQTSDGFGAYSGSGWITSGGGTTTSPAFVAGHVYALAIDIGNSVGWIKDLTAGGNWNSNASADPATNSSGAGFGGNMIPGSPAIYMAVTVGASGDSLTANFGGTSYVGTPPAGFVNW